MPSIVSHDDSFFKDDITDEDVLYWTLFKDDDGSFNESGKQAIVEFAGLVQARERGDSRKAVEHVRTLRKAGFSVVIVGGNH